MKFYLFSEFGFSVPILQAIFLMPFVVILQISLQISFPKGKKSHANEELLNENTHVINIAINNDFFICKNLLKYDYIYTVTCNFYILNPYKIKNVCVVSQRSHKSLIENCSNQLNVGAMNSEQLVRRSLSCETLSKL